MQISESQRKFTMELEGVVSHHPFAGSVMLDDW